MVIAVTCLALGVACFFLLAYALISRSDVAGAFGFRAGRNEITGNGIGILLAGTFGFLALAIGTWPDSTASLQGSDSDAASAPATVPPQPPSPSTSPPGDVVPSSSPPAEARRGEAVAAEFIAAYGAAAASGDFAEDELDEWFVFPVDWYGVKDADSTRLLDLLTPKKPPAERTVFEPAKVTGFAPGNATDVLFASVAFTRASGETGTVDVKYVLVPSKAGQPYRISAVSEV